MGILFAFQDLSPGGADPESGIIVRTSMRGLFRDEIDVILQMTFPIPYDFVFPSLSICIVSLSHPLYNITFYRLDLTTCI